MKANEVGRRPLRMVLLALVVALTQLAVPGCSERDLDTLQPATAPADPIVFADTFEGGLDFAAFEFSYYDAMTVDDVATDAYAGQGSIKVTLPDGEEWAGGSFYTRGPRDLSSFNALTFYARASRSYTMDSAGFGIGINYPSDYQSEVQGIALSTEWTRIVIPIPNSSRMTEEHGMFWFSATSGGVPVTIWFDEVKFANLSSISDPRPVMPTRSLQALVDGRFSVPGTRTTFTVGGVDILVNHTANHFDYFSSDASVVKADQNVITGVSLGEATVTAKLRNVDVQGVITARVVSSITYPDVFIDALDTGLDYGSFGDGQYLQALSVDPTGGVDDSPALQITVPAGQFAGGAIFSTIGGRDLSGFNALVFDARSDQASYTLAAVGYGIGMAFGGTDNQVEIDNVALSTDWRQVVVPIPDAAGLLAESGVFWYSTGQTGNLWIDNIEFATLDASTLNDPRPVMTSATVNLDVGGTATIAGTATTFSVNGADVVVAHKPGYFTYASSNTDVAVASAGVVTAVGGGTATITATLGDTPVAGQINVTVTAPPVPPSTPAPTPTVDAADVISIFSDAYDDITVDTWRATWTFGGIAVTDAQIAGDNVKAYTGFSNPAFYCGIEFTNDLIDAAAAGMTHFHMDIYVTGGSQFGFKLVDFGANGVFGADDTEAQWNLNSGSEPPYAVNQWVSLDIPLTDFAGMNFGHIAQIVLNRANGGSVWLDNLYFHR
ncbi:MAG: hypothetical protein R3D98_02570 [Candidatus Krumholzibacteriia bacterium]